MTLAGNLNIPRDCFFFLQQPSSWKAFVVLNQSARVQVPPPHNRVLEMLVLVIVTRMLRKCAMSIGDLDLEAKLLENLHHYLASSPWHSRLLAGKSSICVKKRELQWKQLQQRKHNQQYEMSSILFGDTMVPKIE